MFLLIEEDLQVRAFANDFNTSHVSINRRAAGKPGIFIGISIHLMFLLIMLARNWRFSPAYFNTSHVSINR